MAKKKSEIQKHPNLKWLLPILVITILLSVFIFYKNSSQNSSQENAPTSVVSTSNWQTYDDSENGYSIKYPESWNYKEVNIEGGAYEGGTILADSSIRFYENGVTPVQTWMKSGNEKLLLRITNDETIKELAESKGISQTTIAGKPAVRYSTGAYIELSSSPNVILSISSTGYPSPELEEILNSLVVN